MGLRILSLRVWSNHALFTISALRKPFLYSSILLANGKFIVAPEQVMALARQAMSFTDLAAGPDAAEKEVLYSVQIPSQ